ncbi:hypothetical protein MBANPS3_004371 [Mucor bainieri]
MTAGFDSFTTEIYLNILHYTKSCSQLAQWRLVCKTLDPYAEKIMFSQRLCFTSITQMKKFYQHLIQKPSLAQCIPALHLGSLFKQDADTLFLKSFLQLTITPKMTSITGKFNPAAMATLSSTVQKGNAGIGAITRLPTEYNYSEGYIETFRSYSRQYVFMLIKLGYCTKSLDVEINPESGLLFLLAKSLPKFPKLAHFKVTFNKCYEYAEDLERLLGQCQHLKTLEFKQSRYANVGGFIAKEEWREWLVESPDVMEYLVYKYPNMEHLELDVCSRDVDDYPLAQRCLDAIQHVNEIHIESWPLQDALTTAYLVQAMKGSKCNRVSVQFNLYMAKDDHGEVIVTKSNRTGASEFEFTFPWEYPMHQFMNHLEQFDTIAYLDMALTGEQDFHFYDFDKLDKVENLRLKIGTLEHTLAGVVDCYDMKLLKSLVLVNAIIAQGALEYLDRFAPSLEQLTLDGCDVVASDDDAYSYDQTINMPHTMLSNLSIITSADSFNKKDVAMIEARWIHNAMRLQTISLEITSMSSKRFPVQYFLLKSGEPSICERISKDEFQDKSRDGSAITVICKSLGTLCIDLGSFKLKLVSGSDGEFSSVPLNG